jgi:hypothetical protein
MRIVVKARAGVERALDAMAATVGQRQWHRRTDPRLGFQSVEQLDRSSQKIGGIVRSSRRSPTRPTCWR